MGVITNITPIFCSDAYGTKLDIEKVLSISTRDSAVCEPVEQTMKYIDSSGKSQTL
ncbi:DUF2790 domain-containing protein [Pseudomonas sp. KSR10]|uniref:DUF2790 domain-containing protein n=1 Tax=Pseudomonadaceae TaxID=135621 RepID=UPI0009BB9DB0|nr:MULTISPECIES: DUF2790 domain-containing protein [Pseudomonadaceae]MCG6538563.1 DUF2790 domain-containing protein [Pseudomonas sp. KSR10]